MITFLKYTLFPIFFSCGIVDMLAPQTGNLINNVKILLDSAKGIEFIPGHDFISQPESLEVFPANNSSYYYQCCKNYSYGGMGPNYNHEDIEYYFKRESDSMAILNSSNQGAKKIPAYFNQISYSRYAENQYRFIPNHGETHFLPIADSAYFTSFLDIDSSQILIYMVMKDQSPSIQIFKESFGMIYEKINNSEHMNASIRECLLTKINGSPIEIVPIVSRIYGMQKAFYNLQITDLTHLIISNSAYDSIFGIQYQPSYSKRVFSIDSSVSFSWDLYDIFELKNQDTTITVRLAHHGAPYSRLDTIKIIGEIVALAYSPFYNLNW